MKTSFDHLSKFKFKVIITKPDNTQLKNIEIIITSNSEAINDNTSINIDINDIITRTLSDNSEERFKVIQRTFQPEIHKKIPEHFQLALKKLI